LISQAYKKIFTSGCSVDCCMPGDMLFLHLGIYELHIKYVCVDIALMPKEQ